MKKIIAVLFLASLLGSVALLPVACGNNVMPTGTAPTATPTRTATPVNTPAVTPVGTGKNWNLFASSLANGRTYPCYGVLGTKMYIYGGWNSSTAGSNDVWSSPNGSTWTQTTVTTPFTARYQASSCSYNSKLWVVGGYISGNYVNDVWSSGDGITWTQTTTSAAFSVRALFPTLNYNSAMWVIGGTTGVPGSGGNANDVYSSTDGATWTQQTASAAFAGRHGHQALSYNGKMWIFGGVNGTGFLNDVWSSTDGITWTRATANAPWTGRSDMGVAVYDNFMWVIAGLSSGSTLDNDVWYSADGANWYEASSAASFAARWSFATYVLNSEIYIVGGNNAVGSVSLQADDWSTP